MDRVIWRVFMALWAVSSAFEIAAGISAPDVLDVRDGLKVPRIGASTIPAQMV